MESPKNLTRNILLGMFLGALVGAFFFYAPFTFVTTSKVFLEEMVFNLGSEIFMNLLKMLVVPLVFFSLVSGIASLTVFEKFWKHCKNSRSVFIYHCTEFRYHYLWVQFSNQDRIIQFHATKC